MTPSLRTRLLTGVVIGTAVLLAMFCVIIDSPTRRTLIHHFDHSLPAPARLFSAVIEDKGFAAHEETDQNAPDESVEEFFFGLFGGLAEIMPGQDAENSAEDNARMTPEFARPEGGAHYQFRTRDGDLTIRSHSLGEDDLSDFEDPSDNFYGERSLPNETPGPADADDGDQGGNDGEEWNGEENEGDDDQDADNEDEGGNDGEEWNGEEDEGNDDQDADNEDEGDNDGEEWNGEEDEGNDDQDAGNEDEGDDDGEEWNSEEDEGNDDQDAGNEDEGDDDGPDIK